MKERDWMKVSLKQLLDYYTTSAIRFNDLFQTTLSVGIVDQGRRTAARYSGIVIPIAGEAYFQLNEEKYVLNRKNFLHAGPSQKIRVEAIGEEPFTYIVLHYITSEENEFALNDKHFLFPLNDTEQLYMNLDLLSKQVEYPGDFSKLRCQTIFIQLIENLLMNLRESKDSQNHLLEKMIQYIHSNYQNDLTMTTLYEEFQVDPRKLPAMFQQFTGLTPLQYLIELKLRDAKELLRNTKQTINEIAVAVGYEDAFYFSRIFKKYNGLSPREYRKNING